MPERCFDMQEVVFNFPKKKSKINLNAFKGFESPIIKHRVTRGAKARSIQCKISVTQCLRISVLKILGGLFI